MNRLRDDGPYRGNVASDDWTLLESLYRAEQPGLVRLARALTGDGRVAEEVVQDAFVRLHHLTTTPDRPGAYLRTIVVNLCRDHRRREATAARLAPAPSRATDPPDLPHDLSEVWRALDALPERRRTAIVLRYYADLDDEAIGQVLGVRPATVRSLVHRGLRSLEGVLQP